MRKNKLLLCVISLMLILTSATQSLAGDVTETPVIRPEKSFLSSSLTTDASSGIVAGDTLTLTTTLTSSSADKKFASAVVKYKLSDGLEAVGEPVFTTLSDFWSISEYSLEGDTLTLKIATAKVDDAVSSLKIDISLRVKEDASGEQSVTFDSLSASDEFNMYFIVVSKKETNNTFTVSDEIETPEPSFANLGASLRINNTPALRFGMSVDKDELYKSVFDTSFVYSADSNMKFGILVIEKSKYSAPLTPEHADVTNKIFTEALSESDDKIVFAITLDEVSDYTKEYVFRPYVMFRASAQDEYTYFYADELVRSAKSVALSALENETDEKKIELLNEFIK